MKDCFRVRATMISNEFIDEHMALANGEYLKEYLYVLRHQGGEITVSMIADALDHTEADVRRALAYWKRTGVLEGVLESSSGERGRNTAGEAAASREETVRDKSVRAEGVGPLKSAVQAEGVEPLKSAVQAEGVGPSKSAVQAEGMGLLKIAVQPEGMNVTKSAGQPIGMEPSKSAGPAEGMEFSKSTGQTQGYRPGVARMSGAERQGDSIYGEMMLNYPGIIRYEDEEAGAEGIGQWDETDHPEGIRKAESGHLDGTGQEAVPQHSAENVQKEKTNSPEGFLVPKETAGSQGTGPEGTSRAIEGGLPERLSMETGQREWSVEPKSGKERIVTDKKQPVTESGRSEQETGTNSRPVYSPQQVSSLAGDEDFSQLLYIAQKYMNKVFTQRECEVFAYLYDGLSMSADLLEYVVEHCVQGGHTSIRYIETVALSWHEKGIASVEEAKSYASSFGKDAFAVMKAFGISGRNPGDSERAMIDKWFKVYGFTKELVLEACSRTLEATHAPSFKYTDKILSGWKKAGVRSFQDIHRLDEEHAGRGRSQEVKNMGKKPGTDSAGTRSKTGQNQFQNFPQRDIDYDALVLKQLSKQ